MTDIDREERIRTRAHEIWERQGKPDGRNDDHWEQARREIEMEDEDASGLKETLNEAIGSETSENGRGEHSAEPAEGDRQTIERELSRGNDSKQS
jgi:hypothetical protein